MEKGEADFELYFDEIIDGTLTRWIDVEVRLLKTSKRNLDFWLDESNELEAQYNKTIKENYFNKEAEKERRSSPLGCLPFPTILGIRIYLSHDSQI